VRLGNICAHTATCAMTASTKGNFAHYVCEYTDKKQKTKKWYAATNAKGFCTNAGGVMSDAIPNLPKRDILS
jgi:hypothetical protein